MEIKKDCPQLRFPEFKNNWEIKKLEEVCEIKTGGKDTQDKSDEGLYPFFVRSNTVERINSFSYDGEAILTSGDGVGVGKNFHYINGKFDFHQRVYCLRDFKKEFLGKYIYFVFSEQFYNRVIKLSAKNSVDSVRLDMIAKMRIFFPSLPEQQKIATFLSSVDTKINQLKQKKTLLEQYKKGVMQKIFAQEIRFKDENGNDFPEWEEMCLGDVLIKNSIRNKEQKYSLVQSVSNKFGFINQVEMFEDRRVASKDTSNYYVIEKGCFAYNPSRIDVGSLAYKYDNETSIISPLYISFNANKEYLIDRFLLSWFSSERFIRQMNSSFEGSVRNTLSYESLIKMDISIPTKEEQTKIANFLSVIDNKIDYCSIQVEKMEAWKKGLLQKMFV